MTRALIADDEPHLALYLRDQLLALWPQLQIVHVARNGIDAAARIAELEPDIAFLDIQMPGLSGLDVANVRFFHADDKYTVVASVDGEFLIRTPIADLVAQLDPEQFWQVHRSTLVNLAWLDGTRRDDASRLFLRMRGHARELPVSRAYVHLFRAM